MYCITEDRKNKENLESLYQKNPPHYVESSHQLKTWTHTVCGYWYEAKKLSMCLAANERCGSPYTWFLTICDDGFSTVAKHRQQWTKISQAFRRRGVVASFTREPSSSGGVHYHLILSSEHRESDLRQFINAALPVQWRYDLRRIDKNHHSLLWYVSKARVKHYENGKFVSADKYADSRLLFTTGCGLKKVGDIGPFWRKSKTTFWNEITEKEKYIHEHTTDESKKLARDLSKLVGGWVPTAQVRRNLALSSLWVRP